MNLDISILNAIYEHGGTVVLAAVGVKLILMLIEQDKTSKNRLSQMSDVYIGYMRQMTEMNNSNNKSELEAINRNLDTIRSTLSNHIMTESKANMKISSGIADILEDKEENVEEISNYIRNIREILTLLRIQLDSVADLVIKSSYDDSVTNELIRSGIVTKQDVHNAIESVKKKNNGV